MWHDWTSTIGLLDCLRLELLPQQSPHNQEQISPTKKDHMTVYLSLHEFRITTRGSYTILLQREGFVQEEEGWHSRMQPLSATSTANASFYRLGVERSLC
jgi:hypothetical protein